VIAPDGIAVDSVGRARYWASRAIWADTEASRHLASLQGDYGTAFEGEYPDDRSPMSAVRWSRIYCSLVSAALRGLRVFALAASATSNRNGPTSWTLPS
jgi:hypothetical protein